MISPETEEMNRGYVEDETALSQGVGGDDWFTIRPMVEADLPQILEIERATFASPWSERSFVKDLHDKRSFCIVPEVEGNVGGYAIAWFVVDELHIANLAVRPEYRRKGLGRKLLESLLQEARRRETRLVTLEVRMSNVPAIELYHRYGFRDVALRRRYYEPDKEDALVMVLDLQTQQ
jgi:ribosomal-protein-alanine N-acetyltransferase